MLEATKAKNYLFQFLSEFPSLDNHTITELVKVIPVIAPTKGTLLMKEGLIPNECYFVLKGLVRQFQFVDGVERTTEFYTESHGTISSTHYTNQTPSNFNLVCMEDCLLIAGNIELDEINIKNFPVLKEIINQMLENDLNLIKEKHSSFILSSPKDRYLQFLEKRTDLLNRVSLHHIASYLGMTPESLSRIRKRIVSSSN